MDKDAKKTQVGYVQYALDYACDSYLVSRRNPIMIGTVICATSGKIAVRYEIPSSLADKALWTGVVDADDECRVKNHAAICNIAKKSTSEYKTPPDQIRTLWNAVMTQKDEWEKLPPPEPDYDVAECPCCGARLKIEGTDLIDISDEEEKTALDDKVFMLAFYGDGVYRHVYVWADNLIDFLKLIIKLHFASPDETIETLTFSFGNFDGSPVLIAEDENFKAVCVAYNHDPTGGKDERKLEIELKAEVIEK